MPQCITCGCELHPERAEKYNYCMAPACQDKNAKGLTMVAVGVNKAAEQYMILDEQTREELASGKYHEARPRRVASRPAGRRPWSPSQERLALLYNAQGLRPDEIARKLRLSPYTVTQIILTSRSQGKL
jgi:DNA-binding NarL/FixJ family response regulator